MPPETTPITTTTPKSSSSSLGQYVSTLYRILAWIHLRVIPVHPNFHIVLLTLYGISTILLFTERPSEDQVIGVVTEEKPVVAESETAVAAANGDGSDEKTPNGHVVVEPKQDQNDRVIQALRLVFSMPSNAWYVFYGTLSINTLVLAATLASTFALHTAWYGSTDLTFARVGAVYSDAVKIQVRYPNLHDELSTRTDVGTLKVLFREASFPGAAWPEAMWKDGPVVQLGEENDWVGVAHLTKLYPSSTYEFRLAHPNSTFLPYPAEPLSFTTFPDPRLRSGNKFSFVAGSGVRFNFPYLPHESANTINVLERLYDWYFKPRPIIPRSSGLDVIPEAVDPVAPAEPEAQAILEAPEKTESAPDPVTPEEPSTTLEAAETPKPTWTFLNSIKWPLFGFNSESVDPPCPPLPPSFVFLVGDVLPAEAPLPLKNELLDAFRSFRTLYASPSLRKIYEKIPLFHISGSPLRPTLGTVQEIQASNAKEAHETYSGSANYPGYSQSSYFDFRHSDAAYFVLDTTTYRSPSDAPEFERTLLGSKQTTDLYAWVGKVNQTVAFKFIVSPVPLSSMWGSNPGSPASWADYPSERTALIDLLSYIPNVLIISGGRNDFAAIEYSTFGTEKIYEFSTGSISGVWTPPIDAPQESLSSIREVRTNITVAVPAEGFSSTEEEKVELVDVRTVKEEALLKSIKFSQPHWTTFEINTHAEPATLTVSVVKAGNPTAPSWSRKFDARPVGGKRVSAVGVALTDGLKGVLSKMGLGKLW